MNSKRFSAATVLVVDDQEVLTLLMSQTLASSGFRVLWANNGQDALTLCRGAEPRVDLLVTDYKMPGMTGLDLARECCRLDDELSVLYISGSLPGDELRKDLSLGNRSFLAKPFRQADFLRSAKALLGLEPLVAPPQDRGSGLERLSMER